jgi:hypothetical protein
VRPSQPLPDADALEELLMEVWQLEAMADNDTETQD